MAKQPTVAGTPGTATEPSGLLRNQLEALREQLEQMRHLGASIAACTAGPFGDADPGEDKPKSVPEPLMDIAEEALHHSHALEASLRQIAKQILPGGID